MTSTPFILYHRIQFLSKFIIGLISLCLFFLFIQPGYGEIYEVNVTRKGRNLYKVTGKNIYIETKYCYEYEYFSDAILRWDGYWGELIFENDGSKCDVKGIYLEAQPLEDGRYAITISREADDWYSVVGYNLFIKTEGCLSLALMEEAILIANYGVYTLLIDGYRCLVEGVYVKMK